jgi:hypothetical protein
MYCSKCGSLNPEQAAQCVRCRTPLRPTAYAAQPPLEDSAAVRMLLPLGRSWWAIAAGYLGLVSILMLPAPFALLCGVIGIIDIKRNPQKHGMGRCLLDIIAGGLMTSLLVLAIFATIFAE